MNWRVRPGNSQWRNFATVGEGFLATAYNLVQQCLYDNNDKKADSWIFPMLFNVVHGLEIYLKAINTMLSYLLDKERKITEGRHDIQTLCGNAKNLLIRLKDREVEQTEQAEQMVLGIKLIEKFVANIYDKTKDMSFARYPLDNKLQGQFYLYDAENEKNNYENEVVDLELFQEQLVYVFHMLDFIFIELEVRIDEK